MLLAIFASAILLPKNPAPPDRLITRIGLDYIKPACRSKGGVRVLFWFRKRVKDHFFVTDLTNIDFLGEVYEGKDEFISFSASVGTSTDKSGDVIFGHFNYQTKDLVMTCNQKTFSQVMKDERMSR